jgi:hypothetical protein
LNEPADTHLRDDGCCRRGLHAGPLAGSAHDDIFISRFQSCSAPHPIFGAEALRLEAYHEHSLAACSCRAIHSSTWQDPSRTRKALRVSPPQPLQQAAPPQQTAYAQHRSCERYRPGWKRRRRLYGIAGSCLDTHYH